MIPIGGGQSGKNLSRHLTSALRYRLHGSARRTARGQPGHGGVARPAPAAGWLAGGRPPAARHPHAGRDRHRQGPRRPPHPRGRAPPRRPLRRRQLRRHPRHAARSRALRLRARRLHRRAPRQARPLPDRPSRRLFLDEIGAPPRAAPGQAPQGHRGPVRPPPRRHARASPPTSGSSPPPTPTSPPPSARAPSARISTTGSPYSRSPLPPLRDRGDDILVLADALPRARLRRLRARPQDAHAVGARAAALPIPGPATCASWAT